MILRATMAVVLSTSIINVSASAAELANTSWRSNCQSASNQDHSNVTATFIEKDVSLITHNFNGSDCAGKSLAALKLTGAYVADAGKIGLMYSSATFTPYDGRVVFYLNLKKAFGYSDWKVNVSKNVAGRSVDGTAKPIPAVGSKSFDIYKIEGTSLFFGKSDQTHSGESEATRPVELDRTRAFQPVDPSQGTDNVDP